MYIPKMKTIAVSNKYGFEKFECIMAHETAHYIDNRLGESKGERYSTDNFEGTAGTIAGNFRKLMNKKSDSDYINSTKECFARALEQYFAIESFGENVSYYESKATGEILYFDAESYVNKANFDATMKPLIKKFLDEEQTFFKYLVELNDEIPTKTATKEESNEIEKAIETFEMLVNLGGTDAELKEWNEAIETFKMLVEDDEIKNDVKLNIGSRFGDWKITQYIPLTHDNLGGLMGGMIKLVNQNTFDDVIIWNDKALRSPKWSISFNNRHIEDKNPILVIKKVLKSYENNPKMKDGGDVENDFDYMSLFKEETPKALALRLKEQKISEEQQQENEYQKGKWSKKYAPTYKDAVKKTIQSYVDAKKTLEDWGSKVYKTNKGVIYSGGDDIHGTAYTIGGINEHRRKRTMAGAKMQMDEAIENLKELGLKEQEITNLLNSSKEQKSETLSLF